MVELGQGDKRWQGNNLLKADFGLCPAGQEPPEVAKGEGMTGYGNRTVNELMKGKTWFEQEVGEVNKELGE